MALKVELKPNERIIIGACVVTNTDQRARLLIDGDRIPILREKDILTAMPSAWPFIEGINNNILNGDLYHALKESKKLIGHEEELIADARSLRATNSGSEADRKSA